MKWIIVVNFITHMGLSGHGELDGEFKTKKECEAFSIMITSIYQARFKEVSLECKKQGEEPA